MFELIHEKLSYTVRGIIFNAHNQLCPMLPKKYYQQAISYPKVTDADLAFIVNFGETSVTFDRLPNYVRDKTATFKWQTPSLDPTLQCAELSNQLLAVLHRVHFELGSGFLHQVYRRATMVEMRQRAIPYKYIKKLPITYHNHPIGEHDVRLILVEDRILVATVAVKSVDDVMKAQLRSRLKQVDAEIALLVNFYPEKLQYFILTKGEATTD